MKQLVFSKFRSVGVAQVILGYQVFIPYTLYLYNRLGKYLQVTEHWEMMQNAQALKGRY